MHDEGMATRPETFWARRRELAPPDDEDAAGGDEGKQLMLLADVSGPEVRPAYRRTAAALEEFECCAASPFETLHLTVKLFDDVVEGTTVDSAAVERATEIVSRGVARTDPFDVELTRFNLFPDVVYAEVEDGGRLSELNRRLCAHPEATTLDRDIEGFIPHLTLGYLTGNEEYDDLVTFLEDNRELAFPTLTVSEVKLAVREVGEWPPTYECLEQYEL